MYTTSAIIIDDELLSRKALSVLLKDFQEVEIVGEADNIADAITLIQNTNPGLVFLDIQLSGENGFDLLEQVEVDFKVIFVTAYNEYAIRAFEVNATDYILKPVDAARLAISIQRVLADQNRKNSKKCKFDYTDTIFLKLNNSTAKFVEISTIIVITSIGNYSKIETTDGHCYHILKTLKQWEAELPGIFFIRVNRATVINIKYISKIEKYSKSYHKVYLKSIGQPFEISRNCFKNLKQLNK